MEESCEVQHEENKGLPDPKKRRFKTPAQLQGLEDFYNEHKYPTESMKAELAEKLDLTEKQVSGWFCHRRLKDKRKDEGVAHVRPDLSSGVIQDRGSGLKQDSCSSTRQDEHKVVDLREVESRRFSRDDVPSVAPNYVPRRHYDGTEMDDTSSESNSAPEDSFCPPNRSPLDFEMPEYRSHNGFITKPRERVGPSGYLKIKGQTENSAITAVKRQLGRHYRDDGPSLGIEFDPLPPGAFESPDVNTNDYPYRVQEPIASGSIDTSGIHKRPDFSSIRDEETYGEPTEYRSLHKSNQMMSHDNFPYRQPEQKRSFPTHSRAFPSQKSSIVTDLYSDYNGSISHGILRKHDAPWMSSDSYSDKHHQPKSGKVTVALDETWSPTYSNMNPKTVRKKERLEPRPGAPVVRQKHLTNIEDRLPSNRILKDNELYMGRRPMGEHHDSMGLEMPPAKDIRAGKKAEEFSPENFAARTSHELSQWSRQMKGFKSPLQIPSSFSEDETAETSSSGEQ